MPKVSITHCASYDEKELDVSIYQALNYIGGLDKFVKPSQRVLLKVNALMSSGPDAAIATHPQFVKAIAKQVLKIGAIPVIGDNPGPASSAIEKTYETIGYKKIADELGIKTINLKLGGTVKINRLTKQNVIPAKLVPDADRGAGIQTPNDILDSPIKSGNDRIKHHAKQIYISKAVLDADVIINLPKLKTHMLTVYTGAVKNMFGAVPGTHKSQFHFMNPSIDDFAALLVDVYRITKPHLNIMDAVVSMEGRGPSAGQARNTGLILAGDDGVALDAVASYIIGYNNPFDIPTTKFAHESGIGEGNLNNISTHGASLESVIIHDYKKAPSVYGATRKIPRFIFNLISPIMQRVRINPVINKNKCTACLICVKSCPARCITIKKNETYKIDHKKCIMCFCCHELCSYKAIDLKKSFLARIFPIEL